MRTAFTPEQLANPDVAASAKAIRTCVHCGFCTATCPTYVLLGDERDSPRGRIELIKAMLEDGGPPPASTVTHVDRCLSCLACTTTCPSGVDYAQLIDHARAHIEAHHVRPWPERVFRWSLAFVLTDRRRLTWAMTLGRLAQPLRRVFETLGWKAMSAMLALVPPTASLSHREAERERAGKAGSGPRGRVILLLGCVEAVLAPHIRAAATRLIERAGYEVVGVPGEGCCGALSEHLGRADEARGLARRNLDAWAEVGAVDAIITTAAGCGTMLKSYRRITGQDVPARDILEFLADIGLPPVTTPTGLSVAYHAACSLQHGQQIKTAPPALLTQAGFDVKPVAEGHLCCGSAGVYNILQPDIATRLRDRKAENINAVGARLVAAGNIGCMAQLAPVLDAPVVHPVELLDWATGGPEPAALQAGSGSTILKVSRR